MMKRTKITLVAGVTALALAGIGGGVAFAANDTGSATPSAGPSNSAPATPAKPAKKHHARGLLARAEHGEVTLPTKTGTETIDIQRGQATAVSATSITVRSKDGFTATYAITGTAKVRKAKAAATVGDVHTGDRVVVLAVKNGGTDTVKRIGDAGVAPAK